MMLTMLATSAVHASPTPPAFVYCSAPSTSPRGPGLIITAIFRSRSNRQFLETAFENYLRRTYAPYGNSWMFPEDGSVCNSFDDRGEAQKRRALDVSRVPQPVQTVFNVSFELN